MAAKLTAPYNKIILTPFKQKTSSGLEAPEADGESRMGEIIALGASPKEFKDLNLAVGQKVIFKKYVSNTIYLPLTNSRYDFIEFEDIVAVINE